METKCLIVRGNNHVLARKSAATWRFRNSSDIVLYRDNELIHGHYGLGYVSDRSGGFVLYYAENPKRLLRLGQKNEVVKP